MFFTQDDYKKIQQWLTKNSVKDTEFSEANIPFNGEETITIVQGNQNKKVFLKDLIAQVFNLGISDFVNITDKYDAPNISLEEAIRLIPSRARKEGQVITFLDMEDHWHIYQFKGILNQWNVLDTWEDLFNWEKLIIDSILPDEEDLTKSPADANGNSYLSLKDREYNPEDFSGLGRVILRKNIVEVEDSIYGKVKKNYLYQDMMNKSNTIYEIRYDFDLNGQEITIPEDCVLDFKGGSLSNGNVIFNKTFIKEYKNSILTNVNGVVSNTELHTSTFGIGVGNDSDFNYTQLQSIVNLTSNINGYNQQLIIWFDWVGKIEISNTIIINKPQSIKGIGKGSSTSLSKTNNNGDIDAVLIFTGIEGSVENLDIRSSNKYGIYFKDVRRFYISDIHIYNCEYGMFFTHSWLVTVRECTIGYCDYCFVVNGEATSFNVIKLFIQNQKKIGIQLSNLTYSTFINCANDGVEDYKATGVQAYNTTASFIDCGHEYTKLNTNFNLERCQIRIIGGQYWSALDDYIPQGNACIFKTFSSNLIVEGAKFGTGQTSPVPIVIDNTTYNYRTSEITFNDCVYNGSWEPDVLTNAAASRLKIKYISNAGMYYKEHGNDVIGSENKKIILNSNNPYYNKGEGSIYLPKDANKQDYFCKVTASDIPINLGKIFRIEEDSTYYYLGIPEMFEKSNNNYLLYTKNNNYILSLNDKFFFAEESKFGTYNYPFYKVKKTTYLGNLEIKTGDVYAYKVYKTSNISNIEDTSDAFKLTLDSYSTNNNFGLFAYGKAGILGINQHGNIFRCSGISYTNTSNPIITLYKKDAIGIPSLDMELYFIGDKSTMASSVVKTVPYIVSGYLKDLEAKKDNGMFVEGQVMYEQEHNKLLVYGKNNKLQGVKLKDSDDVYRGGHNNFPINPTEGQPYFDYDYQRVCHYINGQWIGVDGESKDLRRFGNESVRPKIEEINIPKGYQYFNSEANILSFWNGEAWDKVQTIPLNVPTFGNFNSKPNSNTGIGIGFQYFCTDKQTTEGATDGIMIYHKGNNVWVDALGRVIE